MEGKNPVILSSDPKVKETFRKMIADTTDAIIESYDDNTAYSGKDVYELRKDLENLGFLPDEGLGFDKTLKTVKEEIMPHLKGYKGSVYVVDGRMISEEALGKNFPNTPMLAAAVAVSSFMDKDQFFKDMVESYKHKFAKKPEVIDGNMKALKDAYEVVERAKNA